MRFISLASFFIFSLFINLAFAQDLEIAGNWIVNEELSDVTDDKVELALIAIGVEPTKGFFNRDNEYYRGGPAEQELYDFISYEPTLHISVTELEYTFRYGEFTRPVYMDNRGNRVSLSSINEVPDFSFGHWESNQLIVEGRPRDRGFTVERYSLSDDAMQLSAELLLQPNAFSTPIELLRVYDRLIENEN